MIFVTVGTHTQKFDRLVRSADDLAQLTDEQVIIQRGCSTYIPSSAASFGWTDAREMERLTREARIVISHGGAGAIIMALKFGKPLVIVPRRLKYKEHHNDHQCQLAFAISTTGKALLVDEPSGIRLAEAIQRTINLEARPIASNELVYALRRQFDAWSKNQG